MVELRATVKDSHRRQPRPPLWREARIGLETAALLRDPVLRGEGVADGRGQPVLLIPGFMAGDGSLALMANWLRRTGHRPSRAGMRANVDCSGAAVERLEQRLEKLVRRAGPARGHRSARAAAAASRRCWPRAAPSWSAGIVTLGSPQVDPLAVHPLVRAQVRGGRRGWARSARRGCSSARCLEGDCCSDFWERLAGAAPAAASGFVSVYSRSDGVVDWRACLDPAADEQVEVAHQPLRHGRAAQPPGAPWPRRSSASAAPRRAAAAKAQRVASCAQVRLAGAAGPVADRDALVATGGAARPCAPGAPP